MRKEYMVKEAFRGIHSRKVKEKIKGLQKKFLGKEVPVCKIYLNFIKKGGSPMNNLEI
ncbi:MAG: hypothetical protein NC922_02530 [Candidatus Omnitrophica bacterium]|nr:hypothetical protein [Candidatus Omnitrophota bacterium]